MRVAFFCVDFFEVFCAAVVLNVVAVVRDVNVHLFNLKHEMNDT